MIGVGARAARRWRACASCALALSLAACAPAAPRPPAAPASSARTSAAPARSEDGWRTLAREADGYVVSVPGEPQQVENGFQVHEGDGPTYTVSRVVLKQGGLATDAVLEAGLDALDRVDAQARSLLGDHPVLTGEGLDEDGKQHFLRAVGLGGSVLLLEVAGEPGRVDRKRVDRFFGSLELRTPWTVYASLPGRFTVAVPALAATTWIRTSQNGVEVQGPAFLLGDAADVQMAVMWSVMAPEALRERSVDEWLDASASNYAHGTGAVIHHVTAIESDGIPGREVEAKTGEEWARMRVFIAGNRYYIIVVSSRSREKLKEAMVARFVESVRMAGRP